MKNSTQYIFFFIVWHYLYDKYFIFIIFTFYVLIASVDNVTYYHVTYVYQLCVDILMWHRKKELNADFTFPFNICTHLQAVRMTAR